MAITGSLLVAGIAGCSSDDDGDGDAADTAIGQALTEKLLSGAAVNNEEEARCVAGTTVEAIGEDRLAELGVTPEDVTGMGGTDFTEDALRDIVRAFNFEGQELPAESEQALREVAAECGVPVD